MTYYMPQDLFNLVVLALALGKSVAETSASPVQAESIIERGLRPYISFYTEDSWRAEAEDCAARTLTWLKDSEPDGVAAWLGVLTKTVRRYEPTGKRKPWRLFNGLKVTSSRQPILNRTEQYFNDLARYYMHIKLGTIRT